jgi:hypothetical protein
MEYMAPVSTRSQPATMKLGAAAVMPTPVPATKLPTKLDTLSTLDNVMDLIRLLLE